MKNIPQIILIFKRVYQITRMEQVKELWYFLHVIIRRVYVYLKDVFITELAPYLPEFKNFDKYTDKSQLTPSSKQVIADFAALFIICSIIAIILFISSKLSKNNDDITPTVASLSENLEIVDLTEDDEENFHNENVYELSRFNHLWGDGSSTPQKMIPRRRKVRRKPRPYCIPTDHDSSRHSGLSVKSTQSQHSHYIQRRSKISIPSGYNETWLIRRTRSGHIYGKYPI